MPQLPIIVIIITSQGAVFLRKLNCDLNRAACTVPMSGTNFHTHHTASSDEVNDRQNGILHDRFDSIVPSGTHTRFAMDIPAHTNDTQNACFPSGANLVATSVATPKYAPCGTPDMNRAASSISYDTEDIDNAAPTNIIPLSAMSMFFNRNLWANGSSMAPKHTPSAYAVMQCPACEYDTPNDSDTDVRMPIMTNSEIPNVSGPNARAYIDEGIFICLLIISGAKIHLRTECLF